MNIKPLQVLTFSLFIGASNISQAALSFNLNDVNGNLSGTNAEAGFIEAANFWGVLLNDNITVNIDIAFESLGAGILGQAGSTRENYNYSQIHTALTSDISSVIDATAVANLQNAAGGVDFFINGTADNPNGVGSATPYLDANNSSNNNLMSLTTANAKALGLSTSNSSDANISFSSDFLWDFDASDGITTGTFDFVAVAIHEIGHALGFISFADIVDLNIPPANGPFPSDAFANAGFGLSTLDLYRYSDLSASLGVMDVSADNRDKFFSIDGGTSTFAVNGNNALFSTGVNFGDGRQASHWKDNLGLGIMDPTLSPGTIGQITGLDLIAFDAIGWDLNTGTPVSTPSLAWLLSIGLLPLLGSRKRLNTDSHIS